MKHGRRRAVGVFAAMAVTSLAGFGIDAGRANNNGFGWSLNEAIPKRFAGWRLDTVAAAFVRAPGELEARLYQQLLERTYVDEVGHRIMLSIAYGQDQSAGLELHRPELCYRFAGYAVHSQDKGTVRTVASELAVTRLIAELPQRPEPVTYWMVLGGEHIADGTTFRLRRLAHAVRREAADGLVVRVSSIDPLAPRAFELQARFIYDLTRAVAAADRARIIGRPPEG